MTLKLCREVEDVTQDDVARAAGLTRDEVYNLEKGRTRLQPGQTAYLARILRFPMVVMEGLLHVVRLFYPPPKETSSPPLGLSMKERRIIAGAALTYAATQAEKAAAARLDDHIRAARNQARWVWLEIRTWSVSDCRELLEEAPSLATWALVERLAEESEQAASADARRALDLAELACWVAGRLEGWKAWRDRVEGFARAFLANALRVSGELKTSEAAFTHAWTLWRSGVEAGPGPLDESRLYDLEASLRRALRQLPDALRLLERALDLNPGLESEVRIFIKQAPILELMGRGEDAVAILRRAELLVDEAKNPDQMFALLFNRTVALCRLRRYNEAGAMLGDLGERLMRLGNESQVVRLLWLRSRVYAGLGENKEAETAILQVRRDLMAQGHLYDRALADLELGRLYLRQGRTAETRELASAAEPVFRRLGVEREAEEAVEIFWEAAHREGANMEMVERALEALLQAKPFPLA
ncbi:MAG TPA: helix-turn-helix domain-containing protein [Thermoanaerobaculia bacterium]|nr:helix-turn-helix domain-containing protein [Thermoanaerobaculia bacterium]